MFNFVDSSVHFNNIASMIDAHCVTDVAPSFISELCTMTRNWQHRYKDIIDNVYEYFC